MFTRSLEELVHGDLGLGKRWAPGHGLHMSRGGRGRRAPCQTCLIRPCLEPHSFLYSSSFPSSMSTMCTPVLLSPCFFLLGRMPEVITSIRPYVWPPLLVRQSASISAAFTQTISTLHSFTHSWILAMLSLSRLSYADLVNLAAWYRLF